MPQCFNNQSKDNKKSFCFRFLQMLHALFQIINKWMLGVLLRKLIDASFQHESLEELTRPSTPLLEFVFLFDLSFYTVVALNLTTAAVSVVSHAYLVSVGLLQASHVARRLRQQVLDQAVNLSSSSVGAAGDDGATHTANELILKIKVIEDFHANDKDWILVQTAILFFSFAFAITFSWFGGLTAGACLFLSDWVLKKSEKLRYKFRTDIDHNAAKVNGRLLDIIKNGVKIKMMGQVSHEQDDLAEIEIGSDKSRVVDARIIFGREALKNYLLGLIPILMGIIAWQVIADAEASDAINIGTSVLVAILVMEEGHKAVIRLGFIYDKQVGADDAQAFVDRYLGKVDSTHMDDDNHDNGTKRRFFSSNKFVKTVAKTFSKKPKNEATEHSSDIESGLGSTSDDESSWTRNSIQNGKEIGLTAVMLRYPNRGQPVLNNYTQSFDRRKIHGLVGESGSGKSTALKVIADLIHPQSGIMGHWNGMKTAYVSQDQTLFARTVRQNVTYGAPQEVVADKDVWEALRMANIDHFVASLPNKLDELLISGEGVVSGGQLQRLNLAHLFCTCRDADLVLLDEVLSALDTTSRDFLLEQLQSFLQEKTAIIITHHSEMLRICDSVHEMCPTSSVRSFDPAKVDSSNVETNRQPDIGDEKRPILKGAGAAKSRDSTCSATETNRQPDIDDEKKPVLKGAAAANSMDSTCSATETNRQPDIDDIKQPVLKDAGDGKSMDLSCSALKTNGQPDIDDEQQPVVKDAVTGKSMESAV